MDFSQANKNRFLSAEVLTSEARRVMEDSCGRVFPMQEPRFRGSELVEELVRATELPTDIIGPEVNKILKKSAQDATVDPLQQIEELRSAMLHYLEEVHAQMQAEFDCSEGDRENGLGGSGAVISSVTRLGIKS